MGDAIACGMSSSNTPQYVASVIVNDKRAVGNYDPKSDAFQYTNGDSIIDNTEFSILTYRATLNPSTFYYGHDSICEAVNVPINDWINLVYGDQISYDRLLNIIDREDTTCGKVKLDTGENLQLAATFLDDTARVNSFRMFYIALKDYPQSLEALGFTTALENNGMIFECYVEFDMERRNITYWNVMCDEIPENVSELKFYYITNPTVLEYLDFSLCLVQLLK